MDHARKRMLLINALALASSLIALAAASYFHAQHQAQERQASARR